MKETAERACGSSLLQSVAVCGAAKPVLVSRCGFAETPALMIAAASRASLSRQLARSRRRRKRAFRRRALARATRSVT
jgi:hypothetical protein